MFQRFASHITCRTVLRCNAQIRPPPDRSACRGTAIPRCALHATLTPHLIVTWSEAKKATDSILEAVARRWRCVASAVRWVPGCSPHIILLVAEGNHGIDAHRAARRDVASEKGDQRHEQGSADECVRIGRRNA